MTAAVSKDTFRLEGGSLQPVSLLVTDMNFWGHGILSTGIGYGASLVAQVLKNLPAVWETWVRSLGWEDLLEKGLATHSRILVWRIPWTVEPGESQRIGQT